MRVYAVSVLKIEYLSPISICVYFPIRLLHFDPLLFCVWLLDNSYPICNIYFEIRVGMRRFE